MRILDGLGGNLLGGVEEVEREILGAVTEQGEGEMKVLVILDGMDFLMAGPGVGVEDLMDLVAEIREVSHRTIIPN